jgi:hypothetical protein
MTGFEGAIESRFEPGQGWIASSQVLLAMTDDRRTSKRETHPAATAARCGIAMPIRRSAPEPCRAAFFLRNIFRFCVATAGSAATAPPRNCRRKARFYFMPFIVAAALPRVRRMPAASRQDSPHRG